jgi:hypothetical protein
MLGSPATTRSCAAALLLGVVAGCASFDLPEKITLPKADDKVRTPMSMTALWTDTVLVERGVVGFGGRIMFYGNDQDEPIVVDGELTVFAYDDTGDMKQNSVPAKKYVFRAEDFSKHYSKSSLGHSYSFWVPWDRVGGPQRQVSLIARFKSAKGGVIMSEMTRHLLPGVRLGPDPAEEPPADAVGAPSPVHQAAHHEAVVRRNPKPSGMSTTTITLPEALGAASQSAATTSADPAETLAAEPARLGRTSIAGSTADAASPASQAEIQAMVREAVQDAMAAGQPAPHVDRFEHLKRRARIAPKLRPTRDPAASPLHPATRQYAPRAIPPAGSAIGSATSASVPQPQTQPPQTWGR